MSRKVVACVLVFTYLSLRGFRKIVNHPLLNHLPGIMETPRKDPKDDLRNMEVLRNLITDRG